MDRAGLIAALASAVLVFGCGNGELTRPDASGDDDDDGGINMTPDASDEDVSAIEFEFRTDPEIPDDDLGSPWDGTLSRAEFDLADLRVVGDAAILQESEFELEFSEGERFLLEFSPAAPGIYSTFIGRIERFSVHGTVDAGDGDVQFRIEDNPPASTSFVVVLGNVSVVAGETTNVRIDIDLEDFINEIDWTEAVDDGEGNLTPDPSDLQEVREEMAQAFELN